MATPVTPPPSYHRPSIQAAGIRRSFTQPPRSLSFHERAGLDPSDSAADLLYTHPRARIVAFTPPTDARHSTSSPASREYDYPVDTIETLPWASTTETVLASGSLIIEKVRGSTNFLKSGTKPLHVLMRNSQCWCVDGEAMLVMRIGEFKYYRIELPYASDEDKTKVRELKELLKRIMKFEATPCPFIRGFHVDLPESATTPRKRAPWKRKPGSLLPSPVSSPSPTVSTKKVRARVAPENKLQETANCFPPEAATNESQDASDECDQPVKHDLKQHQDMKEQESSDGSTDSGDDGKQHTVIASTSTRAAAEASDDRASPLADELSAKEGLPGALGRISKEPYQNDLAVKQPSQRRDVEPLSRTSTDQETKEETDEDEEGEIKVPQGAEDEGMGDEEEGLIEKGGVRIEENAKEGMEEEVEEEEDDEDNKSNDADGDHNVDDGEGNEGTESGLIDTISKYPGPQDRADQPRPSLENSSTFDQGAPTHQNAMSSHIQGSSVEESPDANRHLQDLDCKLDVPDTASDHSSQSLGSLTAQSDDSLSNEQAQGFLAIEIATTAIGSERDLPGPESQYSETASISSCAQSFHSLFSQDSDFNAAEITSTELAEPSLPGTFDATAISSQRHKRDVSEMTITAEKMPAGETDAAPSPLRSLIATSEDSPPKSSASTFDSSCRDVDDPARVLANSGLRQRPQRERSFSPLPLESNLYTSSLRSPRDNHLSGAILRRVGHLALETPVEVVVMLVHVLARIAGGATFDDLINGDLFRRPQGRGWGQLRPHHVAMSTSTQMDEGSDDDDFGVPIRGRGRATQTLEEMDVVSDLD